MTEIHDIQENKPHKISMVICLSCYNRWIAVRPEETRLVELECNGCRLIGYTIETGEIIE